MSFVALLLTLAVAAPFPMTSAAGESCAIKRNELGQIVGSVCTGEKGAGADPKADIPAVSPVLTPSAPAPVLGDIGVRVSVGQAPTGEQCAQLTDLVGPGEAGSVASLNAEAQFLDLITFMPQCPGSLAALTASTPVIEAARFWQSMDLPDLAPRIAPGKALVGLPAFLEAGGEVRVTSGGPTPFGPLTITADRAVTVDWADGPGSLTGPHAGSGGPHPDGDITWTYGRSGLRDVAVTQTWTATWSIGGTAGTFSGRGTTATLFAFPVEQIQAVRDR